MNTAELITRSDREVRAIMINGYEVLFTTGTCSECGHEGEVRILTASSGALVCEPCIEEPIN